MRTNNIPFPSLKKAIILNYPKSAAMGFVPRDQERVRNSRGKQAIGVRAIAAMGFVPRDQERVRNSRGKQAIGVRAIEVLLYILLRDLYATLFTLGFDTQISHESRKAKDPFQIAKFKRKHSPCFI